MEIDIAKAFKDKLQEKFDSLFNKVEEKFNNDISELEILKYTFCDIDKEGKIRE